MRYKLPVDRLVNMLVPHFLSGRKYILFVQSVVYPLYTLNNRFVRFAKEKQIEARMTSQVIYFEWYLNYKFRQYFAEPQDTITIVESETIGVPVYHENSVYGKPFTVWYENNIVITSNPLEEPKPFYHIAEERLINKVSFTVCVPEITISEQEFVYMLSYVVNTYRIAGKTYLIRINRKEITPNKRIR